jgi:hypothetical protein
MNTQRWQLNLDQVNIFTAIVPLTVGITLLTATTAPASAQPVVVFGQGIPFGVSQPPPVASYIYGSPIPTPVPVNPMTGLVPSSTYSSYPGYSYPGSGTVVNSTLINPTLVNPRIRNSTLINPVIVNDQFYRSPVLGRSGIIFLP